MFPSTDRSRPIHPGMSGFRARLFHDGYQCSVQLAFIRTGKPIENSLIESFNGRFRDECLNVHLFWTIEDAKEKLAVWQIDYNRDWPHGNLHRMS